MSLHVIIGAGPVGSATAARLAGQGEKVRVLTRSGAGPDAGGVETIAVDATDTERLADLAAGAAVLYNCASPPYHRWPQEWPPLASSARDQTRYLLSGQLHADHPPLRATRRLRSPARRIASVAARAVSREEPSKSGFGRSAERRLSAACSRPVMSA